MSKNDGGPAFPTEPNTQPNVYAHHGMSLRDWFAGQALISMRAWTPGDIPMDPAARARWAYEQADAMLAERERSS